MPLLAQGPNKIAQFFQTPTHLAILHEQNSDLRIVPIRPVGADVPDLGSAIQLWQGRSVAHWEGDTLVIETRSFNGKWTLAGTGAGMTVVERIRRVDADTLDFEFTIDDPESFAGPWTVTFPIIRHSGLIYENACHEGNYSMPLILNGARAIERREASGGQP